MRRTITLKSESELAVMDRCNGIVLRTLAELGGMIRPGIDVADLDAFAEERTRREGARPAFKGYEKFPSTLCVSINEQVVHGIPRARRLREGDIVSLDFGVILDGLYGDGAETFAVGRIEPGVARLLQVTRQSMGLGIEQIRPGRRVGDVGHAVQAHAEAHGYSVVREYVGHGIGRHLHEEPQLPNFGRPGEGVALEAGMVLAIEPMVNMGAAETTLAVDGWTVSTRDGRPSAHFERSVAITRQGPWVLGSGAMPGVAVVDLPQETESAAGGGKGRQ